MRLVPFLALVGSVLAAHVDYKRQTTSWDTQSIFSVLSTAVPSSLTAAAATNSAQLQSYLIQEFITGIPPWYSDLPEDIKRYITAQGQSVLATATATASGSVPSGALPSGSGHGPRNSSSIMNPTLTSTSMTRTSSDASETSGSSNAAETSPSTAGAAPAVPAAVAGGSVAALAGFVAMLVL